MGERPTAQGPAVLIEDPLVPPRPRSRTGSDVILCILGRFDLAIGSESVPVGMSCQRLLTLLAIKAGKINRTRASGMLWPEVRPARASANLRSVLWRLQRCCSGIVEATFYDLRLASGMVVDIHTVSEIAHRLLDRSTPMTTDELRQARRCNLYEDIFPDLDDEDWLLAQHERHRQLRLHALEALAEQLTAVGWFGAAVEAALGAVRADPFRESAHQMLVQAYLSEGNQLAARRQHVEYCNLMWRELGVQPSDEFMALMR
jgi:DNA-binding SARP family transcriptional activator